MEADLTTGPVLDGDWDLDARWSRTNLREGMPDGFRSRSTLRRLPAVAARFPAAVATSPRRVRRSTPRSSNGGPGSWCASVAPGMRITQGMLSSNRNQARARTPGHGDGDFFAGLDSSHQFGCLLA